jgi:hypothetical protein
MIGLRMSNSQLTVCTFVKDSSRAAPWSHYGLGLALGGRARRELAAFNPKESSLAVPRRTERNALSTFFVPVVRAPMARTGQATYHEEKRREENDSTFCESTS